jgi:hypothetical protein
MRVLMSVSVMLPMPLMMAVPVTMLAARHGRRAQPQTDGRCQCGKYRFIRAVHVRSPVCCLVDCAPGTKAS